MELNDFDIFAQAVSALPPAGSAPSALVSNSSLVATGTLGQALTQQPQHAHAHAYDGYFAQPPPPQRRFSFAPSHLHTHAHASSAPPRTPALKPAPALETSPVTPGAAASCTVQNPTPLSLPTAASDAEPAPAAAAITKRATTKSVGVGVGVGGVDAKRAPTSGDVQSLLKWVTREPVALPGSYRPGGGVQRAFESVRTGVGVPNALDMAMAELHRDIAWYVDKRKEAKRHTHKQRLRHVEHRLSMHQREVARHRIEASLTKFKKTENEKALRAAMRWLAEQIQISAVK